MKSALFATVAASILCIGVALQCFECNVWKTGYGHHCPENKIRPENRTGKIEVGGCDVCMKVETTIYSNYYQNKPGSSTIISRVCAREGSVPKKNGCDYYSANAGTSTRCYCNNADFCNHASHTQHSVSALTVTLLMSTYLSRLVLYE